MEKVRDILFIRTVILKKDFSNMNPCQTFMNFHFVENFKAEKSSLSPPIKRVRKYSVPYCSR
jgi:hypothetical protein